MPTANKDAYTRHAARTVPLFKEFGVARFVENWGDDVPDRKLTDFRRPVKAKEDETVIFSWFEYPDRAARDAANEKIMSDPRMKDLGETMPFDGQRKIFGGFSAFLDERDGGKMGSADGFLVPVPGAEPGCLPGTDAEERADLPRIRRPPGRRNLGTTCPRAR